MKWTFWVMLLCFIVQSSFASQLSFDNSTEVNKYATPELTLEFALMRDQLLIQVDFVDSNCVFLQISNEVSLDFISIKDEFVSTVQRSDLSLFIEKFGGDLSIRHPTVFRSLLLIREMIPVDEKLPAVLFGRTKDNDDGNITMICDFIGKLKGGQFTAGTGLLESKAIVGEKASRCRGRCGPGCGFSQQYTQQCLNHDLCRDHTGENLGPCQDEWWNAADSYLFAPDC